MSSSRYENIVCALIAVHIICRNIILITGEDRLRLTGTTSGLIYLFFHCKLFHAATEQYWSCSLVHVTQQNRRQYCH